MSNATKDELDADALQTESPPSPPGLGVSLPSPPEAASDVLVQAISQANLGLLPIQTLPQLPQLLGTTSSAGTSLLLQQLGSQAILPQRLHHNNLPQGQTNSLLAQLLQATQEVQGRLLQPPQAPNLTAAEGASSQTLLLPLLEQLAAAQTQGGHVLPGAQTRNVSCSLLNTLMATLEQASTLRNIPPPQPPTHQHLERQISALLLSQQQATAAGASAASPSTSASGNADLLLQLAALLLSQQQGSQSQSQASLAPTSIPSTRPQVAAHTSSQIELLLRSMATTPAPWPINYGIANTNRGGLGEAASALAIAPNRMLGADILARGGGGVIQRLGPNIAAPAALGRTSSTDSNFPPNISKEERWNLRFEELVSFKQKKGHCRVPHGYRDNKKLSWWVMNQRAQYGLLRSGKKSWLTEDRVMMLEDIGFEWSPGVRKPGKTEE